MSRRQADPFGGDLFAIHLKEGAATPSSSRRSQHTTGKSPYYNLFILSPIRQSFVFLTEGPLLFWLHDEGRLTGRMIAGVSERLGR